jgi:hypothetical protein
MAAYVEFESDPQVPPPYVFPGVTIRSFRLEADLLQLQALCDTFLNIGSLFDRGFEYRAILPFVDLDYLVYPRMLYALQPYSQWGFATQRELYLKFFVAKFVLIDDLFLIPAPELLSFFPYIFVDNYWSAIAGREIIGFPKLLAKFHAGSSLANPYPIKATTSAIETYAPTSELLPLPLVEINDAPQSNPIPIISSWTLPPSLLALLDPMLQAALSAGEAIDPGLLQTVHLKQLRDPAQPTEACYQAIVEGQFAIANLHPFAPPPAQIVLFPHATLSIAAKLGLPAAAPLTPISQFAATCDLTYQNVVTSFVNS